MAFNSGLFSTQPLYETSASAVQLKVYTDRVASQDKLAEKRKRVCTTVAISAFVLTFLTVLMAPAAPTFALIATVLSAITGIVAAILAQYLGRLDVTDVRYKLPPRLCDMLGRDMAKGAVFNIRIDFSKSTAKHKMTHKGPYPARRGWKQAFFEDPWLRISGQLLDSTTFDITLRDHTVVRSGTKRSSSGKIKHKRKVKFKGCEAQLVLKYPRKKYGAMSVLAADLSEAVNIPHGMTLKQIKANDHQLVMRVKAPAEVGAAAENLYQLITQMLLSAYQALNLSKALSKATG